MPNNNDNHPAGATIDTQLFSKLKGCTVYPSEDGNTLYSMATFARHPPIFIEADRTQVAVSVHDLIMAAYIMAKRSGTQPDHFIDQAWILRPRLDCSKVRYNKATRMLAITLCFADRLPIPISISLTDWVMLKNRIDAVSGLLM